MDELFYRKKYIWIEYNPKIQVDFFEGQSWNVRRSRNYIVQ